MRHERIQDRAMGKWRSILPALGVSETYLTGKHTGCPICQGGKDRFRFDDKAGRGTWICNQCGHGNGVDLVMRVKGLQFIEAKKLIEEQLPSARVDLGTRKRDTGSTERFVAMWRAGQQLDGRDPASWYLARRGIAVLDFPALRYLPRAKYWHDDKRVAEHPAMAAIFSAPDKASHTVHFTYLTPEGRKASLDPARKLAPGPVPAGGAVRLFPSAETMGIAEGIETALSAAQLFGVPVWAALTAGALVKWQPPETCKCVIVFGDHDESFTGQASAYALAHRLRKDGYHVDVRFPEEVGNDWNDVLLTQKEAA